MIILSVDRLAINRLEESKFEIFQEFLSKDFPGISLEMIELGRRESHKECIQQHKKKM